MAMALMCGVERPPEKADTPLPTVMKDMTNLMPVRRFGMILKRSHGSEKKGSGTGLPGTADHIFETGQLCCTDRASGMHAACGNTNFSPHAKFTPVSKLG